MYLFSNLCNDTVAKHASQTRSSCYADKVHITNQGPLTDRVFSIALSPFYITTPSVNTLARPGWINEQGGSSLHRDVCRRRRAPTQCEISLMFLCTSDTDPQLVLQDRLTLGALITLDVHARDVVQQLVDAKVAHTTDFEWASQLRYYWRDNVWVEMVQACIAYGYEYLGNTPR